MPPSIVLIGGAPGAGKTSLGRELSRRLGLDSLTVDDLATAIRAVTTPDSHPEFHVMPDGHHAYFTNGPAERLISDAAALERAMWPSLELLIRQRLAIDHGVVIDWWLLPPAAVADVSSDRVASLWIHIDPAVLDRRELSVESFRTGSADPDQMHANFMARSLWRNQLIADEAERLGLTLLEQSGHTSVAQLADEALEALGVDSS